MRNALKNYLKRVRPDRWAWVVFKLVLGLGWTHAMLFVTPPNLLNQINPSFVPPWAIGTAIGAVVSIAGMFIALTRNRRVSFTGLLIEFVGLVALLGGPVQYFSINVGVLFNSFESRYALSWFSLAVVCACAVRLIQVATDIVRKGR